MFNSRKYNITYNAKKKAKVFALYGNRCAHCGFDDPRALQIDHIKGRRNSNRLTGGGLYLAILKGLCANCNWIKRAKNSHEQPHPEVK